MTVVFDLVGVQNRDHGERGIARYVLQLALEVERLAPGLVDRYLVRGDLPIPGGLEPLITTGRVGLAGRDRRDVDIGAGGVFVAGSLFELQNDIDDVLPRVHRDPRWQRLAVLYDLIPLRFPELYLSRPAMRHPYLARVEAARAMDHLLAISQATADDAHTFLGHGPDRTTVIGAGADDRFAPHPGGRAAAVADIESRPPVPRLRPGYIMNPSGIEPRKNIDRLLQAYAGLSPEVRAAHQLVLVCKTTPDEAVDLRDRSIELGIHDDLVVTGYVGDEDLVRLYRAAELVVFPSLYEGFGLPVLEAMRCGAPAICSDSSSLREVQLDPAGRFDPTDVDAIRSAIERVLADETERDRLRAADPPPFTWTVAAERTIEAIGAADRRRQPGRRRSARPRRPRVALVTPLPAHQSGIAAYSARLIPHLREVVDLTCFVDGDLDSVVPIEGVQVHDTTTFDSIDGAGRPFDRIVTMLGNSSFHVDALEVIRSVGGTVVLHDARLTGLYGEVQRHHPDRLEGFGVGPTVAALYPHRYRQAVEHQWVIPPDMAALSGVHLLAEVVAAADQVLVHSEYAATLCELDTGTRPQVAFPIPCLAPSGDTDAALDPDNHAIVSVGIVSPVKEPELLIEAMVHVRRRVPDATLTFVGGGPADLRDLYRARAEALGLEGIVAFTGHVDDECFDQHLRRAAVAVQLRAFTNGESSAAVMDALSAGCPSVVTGLGSMAELPDDAVVKVGVGVRPEGLADQLCELLESVDRRAALQAAARRHVEANGFAAAARRLLDLIGV